MTVEIDLTYPVFVVWLIVMAITAVSYDDPGWQNALRMVGGWVSGALAIIVIWLAVS